MATPSATSLNCHLLFDAPFAGFGSGPVKRLPVPSHRINTGRTSATFALQPPQNTSVRSSERFHRLRGWSQSVSGGIRLHVPLNEDFITNDAEFLRQFHQLH